MNKTSDESESGTVEQSAIKKRMDDFSDYRPSSETPPFPKTVLIELSSLCNHACVFCAYPKTTRPGQRMSLELLDRLLDEAYGLGAREVGFYSGAEPFTSRDLEEAIARAKRCGYEYTFLSTNGSLATKDRLTACIDNGLDSIKFSINGADRETYLRIHGKDDFDRVIDNVRFACEYRREVNRDVYVAVSCVVIESDNVSNVDTPEWLRQTLGAIVDELVVFPANNENGQMIGLAPMDISAPCVLPFARAHISAEGYLRVCCNDYQNYLAVVDLNITPLAEAWNADIFRDIRRRHLDNNLEGLLCHNCIHGVSEPIEPVVSDFAVSVKTDFFNFEPTQSVDSQDAS